MSPSTYTNISELVMAINTRSKALEINEPNEIYQFRCGECKIGTNNQYFTTWDFVNGLLRDQSSGTWYALLRTIEDEQFTMAQFCAMVDRFDLPYSNFLRYSGFPEIATFVGAIRTHLSATTTTPTREEAITVVRASVGYLNRLTAWSFHYFPWNIGKHLTYEIGPTMGAPDLSRRVHITGGRKVRLTWHPLGVSVIALFATKENPELCNDVLEKLPCTVVQDHAVVSGESMYAWVPVVSTAPIRVKERQCDAPIGRIQYSQISGNKIIVQYGVVTEDIETPVLGEILPEHCLQLVEVGRAVWKSTFETKELIRLTLDLA